jgi:hypothetical protein
MHYNVSENFIFKTRENPRAFGVAKGEVFQ